MRVSISVSDAAVATHTRVRSLAPSLARSLALARTTRFRYTWSRHVEKNRRDVEERTEQLKAQNRLLRQSEQAWREERAHLIEKNEMARVKVESMISRLKALEQDS